MKKNIRIQFALGKSNDWVILNLENFMHSLNKYLKKANHGEARGVLKEGFFIIIVNGISEKEVIESFVDPFVRSMRKHGQRFIVSVTKTNENVANMKTFENVSRDKYLTKAILLGCSLKEACEKKDI